MITHPPDIDVLSKGKKISMTEFLTRMKDNRLLEKDPAMMMDLSGFKWSNCLVKMVKRGSTNY